MKDKNTQTEAERTVNGYRDAIQSGAYYIIEWLPGSVVGLLHADLAAYILINELGHETAAKKLNELADTIRKDAARKSPH